MKLEEMFRMRRVKAVGSIILLRMQPPAADRDEAIHILEEYLKLMESPIDSNTTRGKIV